MGVSESEQGPVTALLRQARRGSRDALDQVFPLVYAELRRLAHRQLRGRPSGQTLSTTVLIHEAYVRLVNQSEAQFEDRAHFYAYAARVMRAVLLDYVRTRSAKKRGGGQVALPMDGLELSVEQQADLVLAVDEALSRLGELDERQGRIVECRFFGGMTEAETAEVLGVSDRTVRREWIKARAWLRVALSDDDLTPVSENQEG